MHINIISPFLYIIFVNIITKLTPCPKSTTMKIIRKYHDKHDNLYAINQSIKRTDLRHFSYRKRSE